MVWGRTTGPMQICIVSSHADLMRGCMVACSSSVSAQNPPLEQQRYRLRLPVAGGVVQRRVLVVVDDVEAGLGSDQRLLTTAGLAPEDQSCSRGKPGLVCVCGGGKRGRCREDRQAGMPTQRRMSHRSEFQTQLPACIRVHSKGVTQHQCLTAPALP
eukprot:353447-Chlamydomonas_euryale.AAC.2